MNKKKFMLLIYGTGEEMMALPEEQRQAENKKWYDWDESLQKSKVKVSGEALHVGGKVIRGTSKEITNGLYPPDKKYAIGGFYVIEAESFDKAVEIAKGCPSFAFDNGVVEVREIMGMMQ